MCVAQKDIHGRGHEGGGTTACGGAFSCAHPGQPWHVSEPSNVALQTVDKAKPSTGSAPTSSWH